MWATMLRNCSGVSITFGIVRCGVRSATLNAAAVIPGTFAITSKRGEAGFGEGAGERSTVWHWEQMRRANARPSVRLPSCANVPLLASMVATAAAEKIASTCLMSNAPLFMISIVTR